MTDIKNANDNIKFPVIFSTVILSVFLVYNIVESLPIFLFGMLLLGFAVLCFKNSELFLIATILAPNLMMIKISDASQAFFGYFFLLVEIKYLLKKDVKLNLSLLLHIFFVFITLVLTFDASLVTMLIRNIVFFVFVLYAFDEHDGEFSGNIYKDKIIRAYFYGLLLVVILGLIYYPATGRDIFNGLFAGVNNDRNYFSSLLASGIAMILLYISTAKKSIVYYSAVAFILLVGGLLSASRTFLISLAFSLILVLALFGNPKTIKIALGIFTVLILAFLMFSNPIEQMLETVLDRFENEDIESGSGRFVLWQQYLDMTFSSPLRTLFGSGFATKYVLDGTFTHVEHSTIIQSIFTIGICGTVSLFIIYLELYKTVCSSGKIKMYYLTPLLLCLVSYMAISGLYSDNLNFSVLICFIVADLKSSENKMRIPNKEKLYSAKVY